MTELPPVFVLAAGLGTRLGHHTAKTLYPVAGRPVLERILAECEAQGARRVTVTVLRRHAEDVAAFLASRSRVEVSLSVDESPQGTLGTLLRAWAARPCPRFVVWLGDIVGSPPLPALTRAVQEASAVLLAHRRADYENSGVITVGPAGGPPGARSEPCSPAAPARPAQRVVAFHEKPGRLGTATARVWAGVAALDATAIRDARGADLGRDLWPRLAREGRCLAVDAPESRPLVAVDRPRDSASLERLLGEGIR
jgi:NDP-sugar pyrophosphorylase family protein